MGVIWVKQVVSQGYNNIRTLSSASKPPLQFFSSQKTNTINVLRYLQLQLAVLGNVTENLGPPCTTKTQRDTPSLTV